MFNIDEDVKAKIAEIRKSGMHVGIAIKPGTPADSVYGASLQHFTSIEILINNLVH